MRKHQSRGSFSFVAALAVVACAGSGESIAQMPPAPSSQPAGAASCTVAQALTTLPEDVRETSGLAVSLRHPGILWTHNDSGGDPEIYALGEDGVVKARIRVGGATVTDWEDIEGAPCDSGSCLYVADIGDNAGRREYITIYEIKEPDLSSREVTARAIHARYLDGPQDAEALIRLPSGEMHIVTKGRQGSIKLYRYSPAGANGRGTFQPVREIAPQPANELDRVTAATTSPDGKWVAIRTYTNLYIYRTADLTGTGSAALTYSLAELKEKQGESITLSNDGEVWLTSEAENKKDLPTLAKLTCVLP